MPKLSENDCKSLIKMYLGGDKISLLSKKFSVVRKTINRVLEKYNIQKRPKWSDSYKYTTNNNYFDYIDTEHKAYWLGFIFGDGNVMYKPVYKLRITLANKDKKHLMKFKNSINTTAKIYELNKEKRKYNTIQIISKQTCITLMEYNIVPNKTYVVNNLSLNKIPKYLQRHFMRGYFDADGCVTTGKKKCGKFNIIAHSENIIKQVKKWMNENGVNGGHIYNQRGNYSLNFVGYPNFRKIGDIFYEEATMYLDRKFQHFKNINKEYKKLH